MANDANLLSMAQEFTGLPMDSLIGAPLTAAATANASMAVTQTQFMLDTCFTKTPLTKVTSAPGVTPVTTDLVKDLNGKQVYNYLPIMIKMSLTRGFVVPAIAAVAAVPLDATETARLATLTGQASRTPDEDAEKKALEDKKNGTPASAAKMDTFTTAFDLPLLTIIPLNSLGVDEVDIKFEMEVKSSFSNTQTEESATKAAAEATLEAKFKIGPFSAKITGKASYSSEDKKTSNSHYEKSNSAKYTVHVHAGQLPVPKGVNTIIEAFTNAIQPYEMPK